MNNTLRISESFYSIQGEGKTSGYPSYFIRLGKCNFMSIGVRPDRHIPRVQTIEGYKRITNLKVGEILYAHNEETGKLTTTTITSLFDYKIEEYIELKFENTPLIYTSLEHPFLTNTGWKCASDLTDGDEIIHYSWKEINSKRMKDYNPMYNKSTIQKKVSNTNYSEVAKKISRTRLELFKTGKLTNNLLNLRKTNKERYDEIVSSYSKRMTDNNPMHDPDVVRKSKGAHNLSRYLDTEFMSKTEYEFDKLCKIHNFPLTYVGRFTYPIEDKINGGHVYPDFMIEGTNRVFEIFHSSPDKGSKRIGIKLPGWIEKRREVYEAAGYDCTFVDYRLLNKGDIIDILQTTDFNLVGQNGVKFVSSKVISKRKKLQCYDLACYPHNNFILESLVTHNCGGKDGKLMESGQATWWCDSEYQWRKSVPTSFDDLINKWKEEGIYDRILKGHIHLIWTGGEPTLPEHQIAISNFLDYLNSDTVYSEIETNGSLYINDNLFNKLNQINCSAKLANSGIKENKRINQDAINRIMSHSNYQFKFVISNEEDLIEIQNSFVIPFNINPMNVVLMPGLSKREDFHERTNFTMEMAKKYGYIGLTRLHISAWDMTTGV